MSLLGIDGLLNKKRKLSNELRLLKQLQLDKEAELKFASDSPESLYRDFVNKLCAKAETNTRFDVNVVKAWQAFLSSSAFEIEFCSFGKICEEAQIENEVAEEEAPLIVDEDSNGTTEDTLSVTENQFQNEPIDLSVVQLTNKPRCYGDKWEEGISNYPNSTTPNHLYVQKSPLFSPFNFFNPFVNNNMPFYEPALPSLFPANEFPLSGIERQFANLLSPPFSESSYNTTFPKPGWKKQGKKCFACHFPGCKFVSHWKQSLKVHLRNHLEVKPFKCPHCRKSYPQHKQLELHLSRHFKPSPDLQFKFRCDVEECGKSFLYKHNLSKHKRNIHGIKFLKGRGNIEMKEVLNQEPDISKFLMMSEDEIPLRDNF